MQKLVLTVAVIAIMVWSITSCTQEADQPKPAYRMSEETKARLKQEAMESAKKLRETEKIEQELNQERASIDARLRACYGKDSEECDNLRTVCRSCESYKKPIDWKNCYEYQMQLDRQVQKTKKKIEDLKKPGMK